MLFIITVWINVAAVAGRASTRTISHQTVKSTAESMMAYIGSLDAKCYAEVVTVTHAEFFRDYADLVRSARTAGLVRDGLVTDHTSTYIVPEGALAASSSYKQLAGACAALMSGCKARGRRAELESIHDRARRMQGFMSDLADAN